VATLVRDGLELRYEVHGGSGPALLLPHLNFSWPDYLDLRPFTGRFTVITASPRGFATSSRLDADRAYRVRDMADDLVAVVQEVGFDRFFVLGYSFTGAFAPWIPQPGLVSTPHSTTEPRSPSTENSPNCLRTRSSVTCPARCSHSGATKTGRWALAARSNSPPASTATA
jgi:hypothetical protein